jgi:hypothetical protein
MSEITQNKAAANDPETRVTVSEIARMADDEVTTSAVSNWRRRYPSSAPGGFPAPVGQVPGGGDLFRLDEVLGWLDKGTPARRRLAETIRSNTARTSIWTRFDALRPDLNLEQALVLARAVVALVVASGRPDPWEGVDSDAARNALLDDVEGGDETVAGAFDELRAVDLDLLRRITALVNEAIAELGSAGEAYDVFASAQDRGRMYRRTNEAWSVVDLAVLVSDLADAGAAEVVYDPAAGEGGFLLQAAESGRTRADGGPLLVGVEINRRARQSALQRLLAHGYRPHVWAGDSLTGEGLPPTDDAKDFPYPPSSGKHLRHAPDVILCEPPFGQRLRPEELKRIQARGLEIPRSDDASWAWLELVLAQLASDGRACICLPPRMAFDARTADRRRKLVADGRLEAVIALPAGYSAVTSTPVLLWTLRPSSPRPEVLFIDASAEDGPDSGQSSVRQRISATVEEWRAAMASGARFEPVPGFAASIPAEELERSDVRLVAARWVDAPEAADRDRLHREITTTYAAHRQARADLLGAVGDVLAAEPAEISVLPWAPTSVALTEVATIIRGATGLESDASEGHLVFGTWSFRGEKRYADPTALPPRTVFTQPNDIVVTNIRRPHALVDTEGGNLVAAPLQIVRLKTDAPALNPRLVATFISSRETERLATGTIPRVDLRDLRVPIYPGNADELVELLTALETEAFTALRLVSEANALRDDLISAAWVSLLALEKTGDTGDETRRVLAEVLGKTDDLRTIPDGFLERFLFPVSKGGRSVEQAAQELRKLGLPEPTVEELVAKLEDHDS